MKRSTSIGLVLVACLATACTGIDERDRDDGVTTGGDRPRSPEESPLEGTPCTYLHGDHTLESRIGEGDDAEYRAATFSFEFASNDVAVTNNDVELLYERNMLLVVTVVDDQSFIVDLGDVALVDVPPTVDPNDYPTGYWDEHDALDAVSGHTYVVRTIDGNTRQWAAFRITNLVPNRHVTIEWIRSPDPERLRIPTECL